MVDEGATPPVLLFSKDAFLAMALRRAPNGPSRVVHLEYPLESVEWLEDPAASVVLDVPTDQRMLAYETVRRHHTGQVVLVVDAGEKKLPLPTDTIRLVRPFPVEELLALVWTPPAAPPQPSANGSATTQPHAPVREEAPAGRNRRLAAALLLLATGLILFGVWLVGLWQATRDLQTAAQRAQTELGRVGPALDAHNIAGARWATQRARAAQRSADAVAARWPVRVAARLPVLSGSVEGVDHLLDADRWVIQAADRAVVIASRLERGRHSVFRDGRFNLTVLAGMTDEAQRMQDDLAAARAELDHAQGRLLAPAVGRAKASGLRALDEFDSRVRSLVAVLRVLPSVVGARDRRTYVVVMTNPAELRSSGGKPAAILTMVADRGVLDTTPRPSEVERLQTNSTAWTTLPEDPWQGGSTQVDILEANSSPHFPTSGEELLRAYEAKTGLRAHGVICIDPLAMRALLPPGDPLRVAGYGEVTAGTVAPLTMLTAYERWPDERVRRRHNEVLFSALLERLLDGRMPLAKARALGDQAAERHLLLYFRDPAVQEVVARAAVGGALAPTAHDYLAVYTQNTNASRVDYFQRRAIHQRVELRPDGAAVVTRTIRIANQTPPSPALSPARRTGPSSRYSRSTVAAYLPPGATLRSFEVDGRPTKAVEAREAGRPFVRIGLEVPPGATRTVRMVYDLPAAAARTANGLRYELAADPQALIRPAALVVDVAPPPGMTVQPGPGWSASRGDAVLRVPFTRGFSRQLEVHRS